jgi:ferric-dicitrate binding protein FerR (iron transport regulator)
MSVLQQLFRRYRDGRTNNEEAKLVDGWYEFHDRKPDVLLQAAEAASIEASIWGKIAGNLQEPAFTQPQRPAPRIWLRYASVAAIVITLLTGASLFYQQARQQSSYTSYSAGTGKTEKLLLPDGSTLVLQPGSRVSFISAFDQPVREVVMHNGEIFCEVAKDNSRPFIIHSGQLNVKVLGTSFALRSHKGIREQEVVVQTGKVQVLHQAQLLGTLTAGHRLAYDTATGHVTIQQHKELLADQLQQGWLVLENSSFTDLQALLQSRYGVTLADPDQQLKNAHFSTAFPPATSVTGIMQVLCAIHGVQYKMNHQSIVIH